MRINIRNIQSVDSVKKARRRQADARWRANVTRCYETLKHIIPVYKRASQHQISKATILQTTHKHINFLENMLSSLLVEKGNMYKLDDPVGYSKAEIKKIKEKFIAKIADSMLPRRERRIGVKKARTCAINSSPGKPCYAVDASVPEQNTNSEQSDHSRKQLAEHRDEMNGSVSVGKAQQISECGRVNISKETKGTRCTSMMPTTWSLASVLERVASELQETTNKAGGSSKPSLATNQSLSTGQPASTRRTDCKLNRTNVLTAGKWQVVPRLDTSRQGRTTTIHSVPSLQCVPERIQNIKTDDPATTKPTPEVGDPTLSVSLSPLESTDLGCFTPVKLPEVFKERTPLKIETISSEQDSWNEINLLCDEPLSASDEEGCNNTVLENVLVEGPPSSKDQVTPVCQRYDSNVMAPKKKTIWGSDKLEVFISPSVNKTQNDNHHKPRSTKCRRALADSFPLSSAVVEPGVPLDDTQTDEVLVCDLVTSPVNVPASQIEGYMLFYKKMFQRLSVLKTEPEDGDRIETPEQIYNLWKDMSEDDRQTMTQLAHTEAMHKSELEADVNLVDDLRTVEVLPLADKDDIILKHEYI